MRHQLRLLKSFGGYIQVGDQRLRMKYKGLLVTLWMIGSFAVSTVVFSPLNGIALSFSTTFIFWALLELRDMRGTQ